MILTPPTMHDGFRWRGMRVGLLGGSFNPVHHGHLHIAEVALAKFGLDAVWWLVTPQNPLKQPKGMASYEKRFAGVKKAIGHHPRMLATHLEDELRTTYSYETVIGLRDLFPGTDFIWICGMDNAHIFHRWDQWQAFLEMMPICFIARPPAGSLVRNCPLRLYSGNHQYRAKGHKTDLKTPGIYWLQGTKMIDISSTEIRNKSNS